MADDGNAPRLIASLVALDPEIDGAANVQDALAAIAGGGAATGIPIVRSFPFAFDTPGIVDGVPVFVPVVGEILLDAWIEIDTSWDDVDTNGTEADVGTFDGIATGLFFGARGHAVGLDPGSVVDVEDAGGGLLVGQTAGSAANNISSLAVAASVVGGTVKRVVPSRFTAPTPFLIVASQDGTKGGPTSSPTSGACVLYVVTVIPVAIQP